MPTVYRVANGNHHSSHTAAMKEARELADYHRMAIEVDKITVPKLNLPTFLLAVNCYGGWEAKVEPAGTVEPRKGRKTP
jgi:hypothetical protein